MKSVTISDRIDAKQQVESANQETMFVPMIETREALDCVEEIAAIPDIYRLMTRDAEEAKKRNISSNIQPPTFREAPSSKLQ